MFFSLFILLIFILFRISEELLDEMIIDIAAKLGGVCDEYTENMFTKEFVPDTSHVS